MKSAQVVAERLVKSAFTMYAILTLMSSFMSARIANSIIEKLNVESFKREMKKFW